MSNRQWVKASRPVTPADVFVTVLLGAGLALFIVLMLFGCGSSNPQKAEFVLMDVPSARTTETQGYDMYKIEGHGKRCFIASFGM
jgi:hypothetical protein